MFIPSGKERILSATSKNKTRTKKKNMKAKEKGHKTTTVINYTRKCCFGIVPSSSPRNTIRHVGHIYIYMNFATEFPS